MTEPQVFIPRVLTRKRQPNIPPAVREAWIVRDLSMPARDWSRYDSPPDEVRKANVLKWKLDTRKGR